ncbi:hypothetical protein BY996DRAFT_7701452 [Phakopsora pachyrhizi]|nr:hypothetical protein BY996DRAFT_7701452 [Phakopsora pachyrhizi]
MKPYNSSPNSNHDPVQNLTEDQLGDYEIQTIDQSNQQQQQTQPKHPDVRLNTGEDLSKAGRSSKSHLSPFNLLVSEPYDSEAQLENLGLRNHPNTNSKVQESIDPSSFPGRPTGLHPLALPPLSIKQKLYIIFPQMIGAAIIDGAANFGIGCAMYLNAKNVRIWILKNNTVAGDMAVTIFIQGVATFCIASGMVHVELRKNKVKAFPYPWPDTSWGKTKPQLPENAKTRFGRIWRSFNNDHGLTRGLHFFSGSDVNDIFDSRLTWSQFFKRLAWSVWKGSVLSVLYFFILWPISIAIVSRTKTICLDCIVFLSLSLLNPFLKRSGPVKTWETAITRHQSSKASMELCTAY